MAPLPNPHQYQPETRRDLEFWIRDHLSVSA